MKRLIGVVATLALGACAGDRAPVKAGTPLPADTISVSVGPCFGFCPVYKVSVSPDGTVQYNGERHTAMLGSHERRVGPDTYRMLAADLARFQPARGTTAPVACDAQVTDTSTYVVTWTAPDGSITTAQHQGHCPSGPGQALDAVLRDLPQQLGITDWAQQTSRPGASRG